MPSVNTIELCRPVKTRPRQTQPLDIHTLITVGRHGPPGGKTSLEKHPFSVERGVTPHAREGHGRRFSFVDPVSLRDTKTAVVLQLKRLSLCKCI